MKRTDREVYILEYVGANPMVRRVMVDENGTEYVKVNKRYVELKWFYDSGSLVSDIHYDF